MNFSQANLHDRDKRGPKGRRRFMTIALILSSTLLTAHPVGAKTIAISTTPVQSATPTKSVQTIALKPADEPGQSAPENSTGNLRLLGYGLFLLQIGLIPLKLSKGNVIQTIKQGS